ncbi:sensor histidine kinase [Halogeometricum luteum]|uniref:histidine kinase n=1 Tax=Halogeometricum luteum TaxID=2950537 RepID=A0ABU2G290_9EURY|nr:histidine kinase N-terminal 7TM domain-containing protein [Halogeometricum sp. S3BR5-2]MDS0294606.1 ATP-binding protein [Halogeometricum sp. S3BR5-2]
MFEDPTTAYLFAHLLSGVVAASAALWALRRTDVTGSRTFAALMAADAAWVLASGVEVLARRPSLVVSAAVTRTLLALTVVVVWFRFASVYSGRTRVRRDPAMLAVLAGYIALVAAVLTAPDPFLLADAPFPHTVARDDPSSLAGLAYSGVCIFAGIARLGSLSLRSRHRSSGAVALLVVTAVVATLPRAAEEAGLVPVPTFDHTALGVGFFVVGAAVSVFGRGFLSVDPVARDVLFEELSDPVVVVDGRGRVADYNAAAAALCDRLADGDAVGDPYETACAELAAVVPLRLDEGTDAGETSDDDDAEEVSLRVGGDWRHFAVRRSTPSTGASTGRALVFQDVTALVAYRRELERQNEQLDRFARTVTHDLRNPLNVAQGYLELADGDVDAAATGTLDPARAASLRERFDTVADTHDRMRDIVDDLQTLARKGKSVEETERVRLGEAAEAAWSTVPTAGATLAVVADGVVVADRSRLLSVFENLFRNSVEHGSGDGRGVRIEVAITDDGFVVSDDGEGVDPVEREQVFEYGYTTSRRGTGLGLSIVRTMAESHGWSVRVDDADGGGARFVFTGAATVPDGGE